MLLLMVTFCAIVFHLTHIYHILSKKQKQKPSGKIHSMSHQYYFHEGQTYLSQGQFQEALELFQQCLQQVPTNGDYHFYLAESFLAIGRLQQALNHFQQAQIFTSDINALSRIESIQERMERRQKKPGICFNSLHRSGTMYIYRHLARELDMAEVHISASVPLTYNVLILHLVERLSLGGAIAQDHFLPTPLNIWSLQKYLDKMVVHIRDPRQAMLSSAIQMEAYRQKHPEVIQYAEFNEFVNGPKSTVPLYERLDELIDKEFKGWVNFIDSWIQASHTSTLQILFTQHRELKEEPRRLFKKVLDFYHLSIKDFHLPETTTEGSIMTQSPALNSPHIHFRRGETNEWQGVFSSAQKQKMRNMMPDHFFERFGWDEY